MAKEKQVLFRNDDKIVIKREIINKKSYKLESNFSLLFSTDYRKLTLINLFICLICYFNMIGIGYLVPKSIDELHQFDIFSEKL